MSPAPAAVAPRTGRSPRRARYKTAAPAATDPIRSRSPTFMRTRNLRTGTVQSVLHRPAPGEALVLHDLRSGTVQDPDIGEDWTPRGDPRVIARGLRSGT